MLCLRIQRHLYKLMEKRSLWPVLVIAASIVHLADGKRNMIYRPTERQNRHNLHAFIAAM